VTEERKTTPTSPQVDENASNGHGETSQQTTGTVTVAASELEELRKKAAERDEYLDLARRTKADFENYQKRQQREREQEREFFRGAVVVELLPVLDNLERALNAAKQAGSGDVLLKGVAMVQQQFLEMLRQRFGVIPVPALGEPFDPNRHEALTQQPSREYPANTVIQVVETGYQMNERVLRPAKVIVSSGAET
jgi:molecular chaperone GrpE